MSPRTRELIKDDITDMSSESPDAGEDIADFLTELAELFTHQGNVIDKLSFGGNPAAQTYQTIGQALDAMANAVAENGFVGL